MPEAQVVILGNGTARPRRPLTVTSTKLVELRNPPPTVRLRPPLLVFIPSDLRASAEDSFGVATFEEVSVGDVYTRLRTRLLGELPAAAPRRPSRSASAALEADEAWPFADPLSTVRFLLTAKVNGNDPEAVGASLYELALVPDFELLSDPRRRRRALSATATASRR